MESPSEPTFDPRAIQRQHEFVLRCPEQWLPLLFDIAIGSLSERVEGALVWQQALLSGQLPHEGTWPHNASRAARSALAALQLPRFCLNQPQLVEDVMLDVLRSFSREAIAFDREVSAELARLALIEREQRLRNAEDVANGSKATPAPKKMPVVPLDAATMHALAERAEREVRERQRPRDAPIMTTWEECVRAWQQLEEVFGELGQMLGRGWDLSRSVLAHGGWKHLVRLRALIERLPQVQELVATLGRMQHRDHGPSVLETVLEPVQRLEEERVDVVTPGVPPDVRGVERSGEISRMLPSEALLLLRPSLRMLWHARRTERSLATYRVEGVHSEIVQREVDSTRERILEKPKPVRGPIALVVDCSGSMHGLPERVAKALVLEAARVAHAERRKCLLALFSSTSELVFHELSLDPDGIGRLLEFLSIEMGGGTDGVSALSAMLERCNDEQWRRADVVVVSDGEWPVEQRLNDVVRTARECGVRIHGIQIGNSGRTALHTVCDPVHVFSDWSAVVGG
jgi:uncharacterized protein with von Willebrand factor type A (vWA) domain